MSQQTIGLGRKDVNIILIVVGSIIAFVWLCFLIRWVYRKHKASKESVLPTALAPKPINDTTFVQRHLSALRAWRKPELALSSKASQTTEASSSTAPIELNEIPTVLPPRPQPLGRKPLTYKDWLKRQQGRDRAAEERERIARETWQPTPPRREYWRKVGEEQEARRTRLDKIKQKVGL